MSRSLLHNFVNEFADGFQYFFTSFSGSASLLAPGSGKHLRIYNINIDGPPDIADLVTVEIQDGASAPVWQAVVKAGDHREMNLGGHWWRVDTAVRATRAESSGATDAAVKIGIWYRETDD